MSIFLGALLVGLIGLAAMAVPGVRRHGVGARGHAPRSFSGTRGLATRILPEPRSVLTFLALFGAFGNVFAEALGLSTMTAALAAVAPAVAVEVLALRRLFWLALRFEGRSSTPLEGLVAGRARAVTAFRNGKGIVETVRDGRTVQLSARLLEDQRSLEVRVGERLDIVSVDVDRQRVTVALW
jgi:hypothetical protein